MGRGRAKAKQTRVARELKYHSPNTDLAALQRELAGSHRSDDDFDEYTQYVDDEDDEDDPDADEVDAAEAQGRSDGHS
ncbi:MAG: DUF3073 domain-containing protein [Dactylosporangium sp.]|nr:DUF3073 domain-containing protein [Dactylosporangium sp.]NNJ63521.1 DUF3073 domain-containing protein [Dactylosporangium sp.]